MAGEVGEALTGQKYGDFRRSPNMEDRRDEHGLWQNMLMAIGVEPIDHTEARSRGLAPQEYDPGDLDPAYNRPTPLGAQAGFSSIPEPEPLKTMEQLLKRIEKNGP